MSPHFWEIDLKDVITIVVLVVTAFAIWRGPLKAVEMSRKINREDEELREGNRRKYHVFYELMRTRGIQLHQQHVMALNLIQLEFYGHQEVQATYKRYIESLNEPVPPPDDAQKQISKRRDLLFDLLHEIGRVLGMQFDRRELDRLAYSPQGWFNDEAAIRTARDFFIQVMDGKRAIHIAPLSPDPRFPAPPDKPKGGRD